MPLHHSENLLYEKVDEFDDKDDHINYVMLEDLPFYKSGVTFRDEIATSVGEYDSLRARVRMVDKTVRYGGKSDPYRRSNTNPQACPVPVPRFGRFSISSWTRHHASKTAQMT